VQRLALRVICRDAKLVAYWTNSGHALILAGDGYDANDPQRTLSVRRSSSVNAAGRPYAAPGKAKSRAGSW